MKTFLSITSVLSLLFMTAVYAGHAKPAAELNPAPARAEDPEGVLKGAMLFRRHCVMCHGATGVGNGPAAKSLKGKLPNLTDKTVMSKLTDAQIQEAITNGKKTEVGNMPALGKRLEPKEITEVVNYVRTLAK